MGVIYYLGANVKLIGWSRYSEVKIHKNGTFFIQVLFRITTVYTMIIIAQSQFVLFFIGLILISSAVDEYGFERHDDFDYDSYEDFMSVYLKVLATRAQKWATLLGEGKSVKRTNTVKRYVRKGVPSEFEKYLSYILC